MQYREYYSVLRFDFPRRQVNNSLTMKYIQVTKKGHTWERSASAGGRLVRETSLCGRPAWGIQAITKTQSCDDLETPPSFPCTSVRGGPSHLQRIAEL